MVWGGHPARGKRNCSLLTSLFFSVMKGNDKDQCENLSKVGGQGREVAVHTFLVPFLFF